MLHDEKTTDVGRRRRALISEASAVMGLRAWAFTVGAFALLCSSAGAPPAWCDESTGGTSASAGHNHHAVVDADVYPWSSVGKLFNSVGGACTAVAIAPDRALTAAHCLYAFRTRRFLPADAIHFLLGYARGDYRVNATLARYAIGPGYDPQRERATASADWAVLFLDHALPADVRPLAVADHPLPAGTAVSVGGFGQDRAFMMTADTDCHTLGTTNDGRLIVHDCVTEHGDSGAPLLVRGPDGAYRCIAVTVGLSRSGGKPVGLAAPIDQARLGAVDPGR